MVDKLAKALDGLKNLQLMTSIEEKNISKKTKMFVCALAAEVMVSAKPVNLQNLPVIVENMINFCDDEDSDVRMVADESLNKVIMSLSESNMPKVQLELHKVIKMNGPARCLRAALTRFGQICQYVRPNKGKIHIQMLVPCLVEISKREEESIHETLAASFDNIFKVLGVFLQDNSLKCLIKAFLHNLSSTNPVIRRCSATCIIKLVQYCRKPYIFNSYVLNSLIDCVVPICEENSAQLILGVFGCLRLLLPTLTAVRHDEGISGSFGLRRKHEESYFSVDRLIQVYEMCLHYTNSKDHNIVAAALETLNQILQNPPQQLENFFLSPAGFSRSYIQSTREKKIWSRSGSEMSVACSTIAADESLLDECDLSVHLSDFSGKQNYGSKHVPSKSKEKFGFTDEDIKLVDNPFRDKVFGKMFGSQTTLDNDSDTESSVVSDLNTPPLLLMAGESEEKEPEEVTECSRTNSQDNLYSPSESETFNNTHLRMDTGSFTDAAVPLVHCCRHLTASFLLDASSNSLKPDQIVRVSIKSLAFSCISAIVKMYPVVLRMNVAKTAVDSFPQEISDILLYANHSDPQIRGCVSILVGSFIQSALLECKGFSSDWLNDGNSKLNCQNLVDIILKGLKDKSSVCNRQALAAVRTCINTALLTPYNQHFRAVLQFLPVLTGNSYWLVKVKFVELLSDLPYDHIKDLIQKNLYQNEIVDSVVFPFLGDEDARVRQAAAEALVKIIPALGDTKSPMLDCKSFTVDSNKWLKSKTHNRRPVTYFPPFSYALSDPAEIGYCKVIEFSLSKIVAKLTNSLMVSETKYFLFGYLEALKLLTEKYPTTVYQNGWNCTRPKPENKEQPDFLGSDLITFVYSLIVSSPSVLDLTALSNATILLGNLFAGHSISNLKANYQVSVPTGENETMPEPLWNVLKSEKLAQLAEEIFTHVLKVLNFYTSLVEELAHSNTTEMSATTTSSSAFPGNSLLPLLSPIKKHDKKTTDKAEEKKNKHSSGLAQTAQYTRLQQLLRNAHATYRVSLDKPVGDKFLDLLESNLFTLCVLLEVGTVRETGRCAEEILSYLRSVVSFRSSPTVVCVSQLLKSLFGTNLASNWEEKKFSYFSYQGLYLFDTLFQLPPEFLSEKIHRRINQNSLECDNLNGRLRRHERKLVIKFADKNWLATYIRLFEPMVVKSLQLYTISGNVQLQSDVLQLLNQLVQLRVNYCLLDEKQVFVGFVLKQFELIEQGQIPEVEILLPHIFKFLILLSYEKQHSKSIMSIPKILQLCDGLMASDQPVQTHCIPALVPVVEDVFLLRHLSEDKELETQREVLLSMLLRLAEFPKVMDLLALVLNDSKHNENKERWKRWSRQVADVMLTLSKQDRLQIDTFEGQNSFINLMSALSPNVLRPIDSLLSVMFVEPNDYNCCVSLNRWLSRVTVILETVLFAKEDALLNRLEEVSPSINLTTFIPTSSISSPDPFNFDSFFQVFEPSETFARFIFKAIAVVANKILISLPSSLLLQRKLSIFFVCIYHIVKSGESAACLGTEANEQPLDHSFFPPAADKRAGLFIPGFGPLPKTNLPVPVVDVPVFVLLNSFELLRPKLLEPDCLSTCDTLSECDNIDDTDTLHFLLRNNIRELLILSHEIPIKELILIIRARKSDWAFLLDVISCQNYEKCELSFIEKLLRLLEVTDNSHSTSLLRLLVDRYLATPRLALSLLAGSTACRHVEFLLTLPNDKLADEIDEKSLRHLMLFFNDKKYLKRHFNLWSLLKRLSLRVLRSEFNDIYPPDWFSTDDLKNVSLNEDWYFHQVKQRCCQLTPPGPEIASLLNNLSPQKIIEVFAESNFNVKILKDCLMFPQTLRQKYATEEVDGSPGQLTLQDHLLFKMAKSRVLQAVGEIRREVISFREKVQLNSSNLHFNSPEAVNQELMWDIASSLTYLLEVTYASGSDLEEAHLENTTEFAVFCIEVIRLNIEKQNVDFGPAVNQSNMEIGLKCSAAVLDSKRVRGFMSSNRGSLKSIISHLYDILKSLIPFSLFCRLQEKNKQGSEDMHVWRLRLLLDLVTTKPIIALLPSYLINCMRNVVVNVCRIPELSQNILKVPETCEMQDIDVLEDFISKFSLVGWRNKQQFEEIWVALLAVLGFNTQSDVPAEQTGFMVQASSIAVEGITTLLKNTMIDTQSKILIHHGRDLLQMKNLYQKLPLVCGIYKAGLVNDRSYHFLDNLEISKRDERYLNGLLSVEYLWTAVKQIASQLYEKHSQRLITEGLDIPSCIYLLTELYGQWVYQMSPDIRIITSSLKSAIVISDLFTDIAHFQWLLNFCLRIDEIIVKEDTILLPLLILGSAKAAAIVLPDYDTCERIKKLMLKGSSLPCRTATVQGLLYLLQSYVVCYSVNHPTLPPSGSNFDGDETNFVTNIVDTFLPVALEMVQQFKFGKEATTVEFERCHWSLIFYLLQNYQSTIGDLKDELFSFILSTLRRKNCSESLMELLVRGVERLLLTTIVDDNFKDQVLKVSLDIISTNSVATSRHGLQLMVILSFLDKRAKDIRQLVTGQEDPEKVMKDMEKINVLFEKLKRSYPKEAEVVGEVLSYVLMDFTASDVLTKVIQEFLSSQQPHQKILAGLLFTVFERAEVSLLEDWVVFSLPSFIQGLPISMSIWILNCFFVSASSEPWLRSLFPLVQSRIRMTETEDKRLLCLSGALFYKQITAFDNFYLDMNGIIHQCSHPNDVDVSFTITEEKIFNSIFLYVEVLFNMIKPRKLLFLAVDGVAPRAKMNNQRARRFRKVKDVEIQNKKLLEKGEKVIKESFDSNCISPGTVFMHKLHQQLKYFITSKISTDPTWQKCKVILSGHQTPGEGEHKIMDYIRYMRTQPDYDPNLKHCLFGSDADLIMLGLATHEPNFYILKEKVEFGKKKRMLSINEIEYNMIHLPYLRDYLYIEFEEVQDKLPFKFNLDNIIDDWILMTFLLGNDFIPHLPDLYINTNALPILYKTYKEVLPTLEGYLNENGRLNLPRFQQFMSKLAEHDMQIFEEVYGDLKYLEGKLGRKLLIGKEYIEEEEEDIFNEEEMCGYEVTELKSSGLRDELSSLIKATNDMFLDDGCEDEENDTFMMEFRQRKIDYYSNKMGLGEVTDDILKNQAEGYIRAIQWNLYYYFTGCQSWTWFYPHHYSPYISDVINFKDYTLDFEMGEPFLPFQQLMAILPAGSKELVPRPYQHLMTSSESPIIDFYPLDFEIDVHANQMPWEGIVLIPFVDQKRLTDAIAVYDNQLTAEEKMRNRHGPMHVYTYTNENLGCYEAPEYFPNVAENHAQRMDILGADVTVQKSNLKFGLGTGLPGLKYPTLRQVPFTSSLTNCKVVLFHAPSRDESVMLSITESDCPPLQALADDLLGKTIQVNWPFPVQGKVAAVSDCEVMLSLTEDGQINEKILDVNSKQAWLKNVEFQKEMYLRKRGVDIGKTEVLLYVKSLEGRRYMFDDPTCLSLVKFWSTNTIPWPLQTVIREKMENTEGNEYRYLSDAFPVGSIVFMLGQPHFGSMGRILDSSYCIKNGRLQVQLHAVESLNLGDSPHSHHSEKYLSWKLTVYKFLGKMAAKNLGISCRLFARITGFIFIDTWVPGGKKESNSKVNIGLQMKMNSTNAELPGYTRKDNEFWQYSLNAVKVVSQYVKKFPKIVESISCNLENRKIAMEDIFPGSDGAERMEEIVNWIDQQEHRKTEFVMCGSQVLNRSTVLKLEEQLRRSRRKSIVKTIQVKPSLLYKSDLVIGNLPPIKSVKHLLFDTVVSVRSSYTVPTGLRGIIIGIIEGDKNAETMYHILFEEPFVGGLALNSKENRVYKMPESYFLNLSEGNRNCQKVVYHKDGNVNDKIQSVTLNRLKDNPVSAFAKWANNQKPLIMLPESQHPPQPKALPQENVKINDQFKMMWSNQTKPQEETLKKLLKIGVNEGQSERKSQGQRQQFHQQGQPKFEGIEEPVKMFFQKINTVTSGSSMLPYSDRKPNDNKLLPEWATIPENFAHAPEKTETRKMCYKRVTENQRNTLDALFNATSKERSRCQVPQEVNQFQNRKLEKNHGVVPPKLPYPPPKWVLQRPKQNFQNSTSGYQQGNQSQQGSSGVQRYNQKKTEVKPQTKVTASTAGIKSTDSALGFVPLQVFTGKRNFKPIVTTQSRTTTNSIVDHERRAEVIEAMISQSESAKKKPGHREIPHTIRKAKIAANLNLDPNHHLGVAGQKCL
ncbi:hypothetical protein RUM44_000151 [Polyplax serrata]|uniref:Huntingtin n=1 Tax=Polyplax serrata TaxID=468196 RepID=A0ABR1B4Q4_POLSC